MSSAVRQQILKCGLLPPNRVAVIPNGVHPSCSPLPDAAADSEAARLLKIGEDSPCFLHVGSSSSRKRIDLLLPIFAGLLRDFPKAQLVHVGGAFTPDQAHLAAQLNLENAIHALPFLNRSVLAAIYRRSALLLLPSEAEGFGLPIVEALACGTPVVATDLPVLREVGGAAVTYCPLGDLPAWIEASVTLLRESTESPEEWQARIRVGTKRASTFTWAEHTRKIVALYEELLS